MGEASAHEASSPSWLSACLRLCEAAEPPPSSKISAAAWALPAAPLAIEKAPSDDARTTWGLNTAYTRRFDWIDMDSIVTVGAQLRNDDVDNGLWHAAQRVRLADCFAKAANPCNHTMDRIRDVGAYAEANIHLLPHVHVLPGLRFEQLTWDVTDLDPATNLTGSAGRAMVLPKLSVRS